MTSSDPGVVGAVPADWEPLIAALRSARTVVLAGHVNPDADALGSTFGIGLALREVGIEVHVSYPGMQRESGRALLPSSLSWLPGTELLVTADELWPSPDVAISCDVSSPDRLGELYPLLSKAGLFAAIDHHQSYTGFADVAVIDSLAPATTVLALELIDRLGVEVSVDIATCLYAGLSTDTGSFRWAATNAGAHEMAARLHRVGIDHAAITRRLYDERPFAEWGMIGAALGRAKLEPAAVGGMGLLWTSVLAEDRLRRGLAEQSAEGVVDALRRTAGAEVAAVLKQLNDHSWKVSLRSNGRVDVGAACLDLGGGGHRCAGGYTVVSDDSMESAEPIRFVAAVISQLRAVLNLRAVAAPNG